jgi:hypothetical protein
MLVLCTFTLVSSSFSQFQVISCNLLGIKLKLPETTKNPKLIVIYQVFTQNGTGYENDKPLYLTTNCRIAQIPECYPKKEIVTEMPKVAQSVILAPVLKKSDIIQLQYTNFPKKDSESSENSEYTKDSEDSEDSEYLNNIVSDENLYKSDESSDDLPKNAKFLFICTRQGAQFHK